MSLVLTYVVQSGHCGPFKIGRARNVDRRLSDLRAGSSQPLRLVAVIRGDVERQLHDRFASHRVNGEWFNAVPPIVDFVTWLYEDAEAYVVAIRQGRDMLPRLPCGEPCR